MSKIIRLSESDLKRLIKRGVQSRMLKETIDIDMNSARSWPVDATPEDLGIALNRLFQDVGYDLPLEKEDPSDQAFIDFAADRMTDLRIPRDLIERAKVWLRKGAMGKLQ